MITDDQKQSEVVRHSGSTEKQRVRLGDNIQPLYSSNANPKYSSENRNLDVCVSD